MRGIQLNKARSAKRLKWPQKCGDTVFNPTQFETSFPAECRDLFLLLFADLGEVGQSERCGVKKRHRMFLTLPNFACRGQTMSDGGKRFSYT